MQPPGLITLLGMLNFHIWYHTVPAIVDKLSQTTYGTRLLTIIYWLDATVPPRVMLLILTGLLKLCIGGPLSFKPHPSCFEDAIETFTESVLNCVPPAPPSPFVGLDFSSPKPRPRRSSTRPPSPKSRCRRMSGQQKVPLESEDDTYDPFTFPYTYDPSRPLPPISLPPGFPLLTREMLLPADWFPAVDPDTPRQEMPVWDGEGLDDILDKPTTTLSPAPTPAPVEAAKNVQQVEPAELETAELDESDSDDSDYSDAASSLLEDSDCPDGSETSDDGDASDECGEYDDTDDEDSEEESEQDDSGNESSREEDTSVANAEDATTAETAQVADAAQALEAAVAADEKTSVSTAQTVPDDKDTSSSDMETDDSDALAEPFSVPLKRTAAVRWPQTSTTRDSNSPKSPPRRKKLRHFARGIGSLRDKRGIEAVPGGESDIDDYIHKHDIMYPFYEPSRIRNADSEVDDEPRRPAPRRKKRYQTLECSRPAFKRSRTRAYRASSIDTDNSDDEDEACDSTALQRVSRVQSLSIVTRLKTRLSFLAAARKRFNRFISVTLYGIAAPEATTADEGDSDGLDSSLDGETVGEAIAPETTQFTFTPPNELPNNLSIPVLNQDPLDAQTASESTICAGAENDFIASEQLEPPHLDSPKDGDLEDDLIAAEEEDNASDCFSLGIDSPAGFQPPTADEADAVETEEGDAFAAEEADAPTTPALAKTWSTSWALVLFRRRPAKRRSTAPPALADTPLHRRRSRGSKRPRTNYPDVAGVREKRKFEDVSPEASHQDSTSLYRSASFGTKKADSNPQTLEGGLPAQKRPRHIGPGLADNTTDNFSYTYIRTSPRPLVTTPFSSPRTKRHAECRFPSRTPSSVVADLDAKPASPSSTSPHTARQIGDSWIGSAGLMFRIDQYGQQRRLAEVVDMRQVHKMRTGTDESIETATYRVLVERWVTDEEYAALCVEGKLAWQVFERDQQASLCDKENEEDESCTPPASSPSLPLSNEDSTRPAASAIFTLPQTICPDTLATPSFEPSMGAELSDLSFDFVPTAASFAGHGTAVMASSSPEASASNIAADEQVWVPPHSFGLATCVHAKTRAPSFAPSVAMTPFHHGWPAVDGGTRCTRLTARMPI
ncbi:hypothetical protein JCM10049v2_002887 [Rhodotorula toruloides]